MGGWLKLALGAGYLFLYAPIAVLAVQSFNASDRVNIWGGFSARWYAELWRNAVILEAAATSLAVAAISATLATLIGTLAALAFARLGRFNGRTLLSGMMSAPLVMPEIVVGISMLLLFVTLEQTIGWPAKRGFVTVVIAHATFFAAFVAVVVRARLATLDPSLEEAAADLGSTPARAFRKVVLPLLAPALAAGWLLAFTLSFDDVVVASFVTGPDATTLPILVFSMVRTGVSPEVNALATLFILAVGLAVALATGVALRFDKRPPPSGLT